MGAWGTGLYSEDFAADLRSTIAAVTRLPFDANRLVEILCETESGAANDSEDPDHTIFWLVLADQFCKRGLTCDRVRDVALKIIDSDQDMANLKELGLTRAELAKRRKTLAELKAKLIAPVTISKPRKLLKQPQTLLMEAGDLLIYPTCGGKSVNPYFTEKQLQLTGWVADGWGALLIVESGRAFDFLSWYRALTIYDSLPQKPDVDSLRSHDGWVLRNPGTCSASHFKRMKLEKMHRFTIDDVRFRQCFQNLEPGTYAAVQDVSIGNELNIGPAHKGFYRFQHQADGELARIPLPSIRNLAAITDEK